MVLWRSCASLVVGWGLRAAIAPITALLYPRSWIWISENSMLLLRTWVSGACDDKCRVPADTSGRKSPRVIRLAPRPSHRCPHPADEPDRPLRSAPQTLSGGLEAQSLSPIVLRRAP
jgi:hypothetical protein